MQVLWALLIGSAFLGMTVLNCRLSEKENPRDTKKLDINLGAGRERGVRRRE